MSARVVLTPYSNTIPFQERSVTLEQPLKIGRSVARSRPGPSNAIFDCKVLSRNHAVLWFENGKFYLQDTKSSNGTFVNDVRLSKSTEESPPTQISSGDVLQFGVAVMEITKKVTHGCIIASLQLFAPDGTEARSQVLNEVTPQTSLHDVYKLHHYISEASEREKKLESRIAELQEALSNTSESVSNGWKVLFEEDRLITRIDILERQLQASHKSMTDDKLKEEVIRLTGDKEKYQEAAKEALCKAMTDKMEAITKSQDLERSLKRSEDEAKFLESQLSEMVRMSSEIGCRVQELEKVKVELESQLGEQERKYKGEIENLSSSLALTQKLCGERERDLLNITTSVQGDTGSHNAIGVDPGSETEINAELAELRADLEAVRSEKREIIERITYIISIFEEFFGASNKSGLSAYLKDIVNKLETEVKQIKNILGGQQQLLKNNKNISQKDLIRQDLSNDNCIEGIEGKKEKDDAVLEKLLQEAREKVQSLQRENCDFSAENMTLKAERTTLSEKIAKLEKKENDLSGAWKKNNELKGVVSGLETSKSKLEHELKLLQTSHSSLSDKIKGKEDAIQRLRDESAKQKLLLDLNKKEIEKLEKQVLTLENKKRPSDPNTTSLKVIVGKVRKDVAAKLQETEEELATYKEQYRLSANECSRLAKSLEDQKSFSQNQYMRWELLVPIVFAIILAILIAFHPTNIL